MNSPRLLILSASTALLAVAGLLAPSGAAAGSAVAPWGDSLEVSFGAQPVAPAGPLPGPQPMTLDFKSSSQGPDGSDARNPRYAIVRLPRGMRYNGRYFPKCKPRMAPKCPRGSRLGRGHALAKWPGIEQPWRISLRLFNGPLRRGNPTELFFAKTPIGTLTFIGVARSDPQGPYGAATVFDIEQMLGPEPAFSITRFDVRTRNRTVVRGTGSRRRSIPIFSAPRHCGGAWSFAYDFVYASGEVLRATDELPCEPSA